MIKRYIDVKTAREGFHCWKDAPDEVYFLREVHRHMFYVYATIQVFHDDRELEFFIVQRFLDVALDNYWQHKNDHDVGSCEMIAEDLVNQIQEKYGTNREITVKVYEDNENGGIVEYKP